MYFLETPRDYMAIALGSLVMFALGVLPASAASIAVSGSATPYVSQTGVLHVERDVFRNGGWQFRKLDSSYPSYPYDATYAVGSAPVSFDLSTLVPAGAKIDEAVFSWSFSGLTASDGGSLGYGGWPNLADIPRVHGDSTPCSGSLCSPARLQRVSPNYNFFASDVRLEGVSTTSFSPQIGAATGSFDLLGTWSGADLLTHKLDFDGSVLLNVGRPFFDTEGYNADTEFNVNASAQANEFVTLTLQFDPPPIATPEPQSGLLAGLALLMVGLGIRRKEAI